MDKNLFLLSFQTAQLLKYHGLEEPLRYICCGIKWRDSSKLTTNCVTEWEDSWGCPKSKTKKKKKRLFCEEKEEGLYFNCVETG